MIINDCYDVTFEINGKELLNSHLASNFYFTYSEDLADGFPICQANFITSYDFISSNPIVDGSLMTITIADIVSKVKETLRFRTSAVKITPDTGICMLNVEGYLDFYEFFRNPNKYASYGLSSEIFSKVARENKMNSDIDQTNDAQLWVPSEENVGSWLNLVAKHGWTSSNSCMIWWVDRLRKLCYKDLGDLFYNSKNTKTFQYGEPTSADYKEKIYKYKNAKFYTNTGLENVKSNGYGGKNHRFDLLDYSIKTENANKVRAVTEIVNVNKELSQGVSEDMMEFDVGNFHDHYFLAEKQNKRIRSLFSTYAQLTTPNYLPIRLGEVVTLVPSSNGAENEQVKSLNCRYIVSSLSLIMTQNSISVNTILCTSGYNGASKESY